MAETAGVKTEELPRMLRLFDCTGQLSHSNRWTSDINTNVRLIYGKSAYNARIAEYGKKAEK